MELSPAIKRHKLKRAEEYRNNACTFVNQLREGESPDRRAFIYLHEALTDVATGLLDLLDIPYMEDWPLSRYMALLCETAPNLPEVCIGVSPQTYDAIYTETSTEKWSEASSISKELLIYAANFNGDSELVMDGGSLITRLLHLLERYSESEIEIALDLKSEKAGLGWLYDLSEEEGDRIYAILSSRRRAKWKITPPVYIGGENMKNKPERIPEIQPILTGDGRFAYVNSTAHDDAIIGSILGSMNDDEPPAPPMSNKEFMQKLRDGKKSRDV